MKEHVPVTLGTSPSMSLSGRTTWFLECGFILHPMANSVIRAVSSVKDLKQEQRHFLGNASLLIRGFGPVGGFEFLDTKCQRRLPPEGEEREGMEKQSMSLAGAPGIVCAACLIFF